MHLLRLCTQTSHFHRGRDPIRRRTGRAAIVVVALVVGAASLRTQGSAKAQDTPIAAADQITVPLAVAWRFTGNLYGNNAASPVIDNGVVYFATGKHLFAVEAATGEQKWRYPSDQTASSSFTIEASPTVAGDTLFVGASDGLYAVNVADGTIKWHYSLPSLVFAPPIVTNDAVYFTAENNRLYAVDRKTGDSLKGVWNNKKNPGIELGGDLNMPPSLSDGTIFYVTGNQILHAIDLKTGGQRYAYRLDGDVKSAAPVITGESMYLATGNILSSYRLATGTRRWFIRLYEAAVAPPAVDSEGNAYVVTADRCVYAINPQSRSIWRKSVRLDDVAMSRPLVSGNLLIIGGAQGGIYALDLATGDLKWSYRVLPSSINANYVPTTTNVAARPVVSGGTLYVLSDDGSLTAFRHDVPDTLPPTVSQLLPDQGDYVNGRPPFRVSARVVDEGCGINVSTLHLQLDGREIPRRPPGIESGVDRDDFVWDAQDNRLDYSTQETEAGRGSELKDGHHSVTVSVRDWMGNETAKTWTFVVDDTIPRRTRTNNQPGQPGFPGGPNSGGGFPGAK